MKRRNFFKIFGGAAIALLAPRVAKAKVCISNNAIWPVGSIYISTSATNPASIFGFGVWQRFSQGTVLVGVSDSDTDFNFRSDFLVRGAKTHTLTPPEMPSHNHLPGAGGSFVTSVTSGSSSTGSMTRYNSTINATSRSGGDQPHNNLQPYITCYMWKRVS